MMMVVAAGLRLNISAPFLQKHQSNSDQKSYSKYTTKNNAIVNFGGIRNGNKWLNNSRNENSKTGVQKELSKFGKCSRFHFNNSVRSSSSGKLLILSSFKSCHVRCAKLKKFSITDTL